MYPTNHYDLTTEAALELNTATEIISLQDVVKHGPSAAPPAERSGFPCPLRLYIYHNVEEGHPSPRVLGYLDSWN